MDKKTVEKLKNLNKQFYKVQAKSFSDTRQVHWPGWEKLMDEFVDKFVDSKKDGLRILDIGCGNGRFLKWLIQNKIDKGEYMGVDFSEELINRAREGMENTKTKMKIDFENFDVMQPGSLKGKFSELFDRIIIFGVMHHVPGFENRLRFLKEAVSLLEKNGRIYLTLWQFSKSSRLKKLIIRHELEGLEEGDFLLDWDKSGLPRYCHNFSDEEVEQLKSELQKMGLKVVNEYNADGKEGNLNRYLILSL